ncbi:MAG: thiamine phosphate synthase [Rhodospirillales bacterium]|nr:thiamine phosphate synthase [Rhodospirillales bacterium]
MTTQEDPGCRLYLVTPGGLASEPAVTAFARDLSDALGAGEVAAVLLRTEGLDDLAAKHAAATLGPIAQARDVAFLVEDRPRIAEAAGADGVHLSAPGGSIAEVRALVGPEAIVGVACGSSRHRALESAEGGADYVAFAGPREEVEDLLSWWQAAMTPPCVALGDPEADGDFGPDFETAARLARAGADFLAAGEAFWRFPGGPAAAVAILLERLVQPKA